MAGFAVASMVLGILWIYWIGSILAVVFGHIALSQIKRANGWKTGRGMAIAGVVLGWIGIVTLTLAIIGTIVTANDDDDARPTGTTQADTTQADDSGAQVSALLPISVTPSSGVEGTVVTVSGRDCLSDSRPGDVELYVWYGDEEEPDVYGVAPDETGAWSIEYAIESTATNPVGLYDVSATCFESPESDVVIDDYDFATFEVTAPS